MSKLRRYNRERVTRNAYDDDFDEFDDDMDLDLYDDEDDDDDDLDMYDDDDDDENGVNAV